MWGRMGQQRRKYIVYKVIMFEADIEQFHFIQTRGKDCFYFARPKSTNCNGFITNICKGTCITKLNMGLPY